MLPDSGFDKYVDRLRSMGDMQLSPGGSAFAKLSTPARPAAHSAARAPQAPAPVEIPAPVEAPVAVEPAAVEPARSEPPLVEPEPLTHASSEPVLPVQVEPEPVVPVPAEPEPAAPVVAEPEPRAPVPAQPEPLVPTVTRTPAAEHVPDRPVRAQSAPASLASGPPPQAVPLLSALPVAPLPTRPLALIQDEVMPAAPPAELPQRNPEPAHRTSAPVARARVLPERSPSRLAAAPAPPVSPGALSRNGFPGGAGARVSRAEPVPVEPSLFVPTVQPLPQEPAEPPTGALLVADELFEALRSGRHVPSERDVAADPTIAPASEPDHVPDPEPEPAVDLVPEVEPESDVRPRPDVETDVETDVAPEPAAAASLFAGTPLWEPETRSPDPHVLRPARLAGGPGVTRRGLRGLTDPVAPSGSAPAPEATPPPELEPPAEPEPSLPGPELVVEPDVVPDVTEPVAERPSFVPVEGALSAFEVQGSAPPLTPRRSRPGRGERSGERPNGQLADRTEGPLNGQATGYANGQATGHANGQATGYANGLGRPDAPPDPRTYRRPAGVPAPVGSFNDGLTELAPPPVDPDRRQPDLNGRPESAALHEPALHEPALHDPAPFHSAPYEPALVDLESVFPDPPEEKPERKNGRKPGQPRRGNPGGPPPADGRRTPGGGMRRFAVPALTGLLVASVAAAAAFVVITKLQDENGSLRSGAQSTSLAAPAASAPAVTPSAAPAVAVRPAKFGVFRGTSKADVAGFERWSGRDVDMVVDFTLRSTWSEIANPTGMLQEWKGSGHRLVLSTAMLPVQQQASMAAGARGEYDAYYRTLARNLVATGQKDAVVRLGWEFNLGSSRWSTGNPKVFIKYWRSIVDAMRSVPGQKFEFDWNPNVGDTAYDGTLYYPGADYVDYIGVDVYDISWEPDTYPYPAGCDAACRLPRQEAVWDRLYAGDGGLGSWSAFARAKGKPMSLPEWGLWDREDHRGGLDNPYFIKQMYKFVADPENNVAYQAYFEVSQGKAQHSMQEDFPKAGKVFRKLFAKSG